jgi:hypothetical protein
MPRTLIVPGVSVSTQFDVAPPLPARSGILGAVGVVDRGAGVRSVTARQEAIDLLGKATQYSFPEVFTALSNGVSEVVVSAVDPSSGQVATAILKDDEGDAVAELRARAAGPWGNKLSVQVLRRVAPDGTVRNVRVQVLYRGAVIETHDGLIVRDGHDRDLFTVINRDSGTIVALDPLWQTDLPVLDAGFVAFETSAASKATGVLKGAEAVVHVTASAGGIAGNQVSFAVEAGRATATFKSGTDKDSVRVKARAAGSDGAQIKIEIVTSAAAGVDVNVTGLGPVLRQYKGLGTVKAVVDALNSDPDVTAEGFGTELPAPVPQTALADTRTIVLSVESVRTARFEDLASATAIAGALAQDGTVTASILGTPTALPDVASTNRFYLSGGREAGPLRSYAGQTNPSASIVEIFPAEGDGPTTRLRIAAGTRPSTVRVIAGIDPGTGFQQQELFDDLTLDPDSERYLIDVLAAESKLLRAVSHHQRLHASYFPAESLTPIKLAGGAAPALAAYETAIDALAQEEAVDMVLAGLQEWADPNLDGIAVQRALLGHSRAQADNARPRFVLGSIRPSANHDVKAILDHAAQVGDRRFVLVAPAGTEAAMAGLLGHLDFFQSPTFKSVAAPGAPLVAYSDADLNKLVGPEGNICVIRERRGRGTICIKGIATDGFQISVLRVADRSVREVRAISDKFIGELNNADSRNALKQMIIATFKQMERDGALVPSVDGSSPAFLVDVYGSQEDSAAGIVRIDIAVRPVRAIDYVYATLRIKN